MTNPFEDENGSYLVLINDAGQYSLWPEYIEVPDGWSTTHGPETRQACLDYVHLNCPDLRSRRLIEAGEASAADSDSRA